MQVQCPHCHSSIDADPSQTKAIVCPGCGSSIQLDADATGAWLPSEAPRRLGKFELLEQLGIGAFGTVYKARDPELDRLVAIKIPRAGSIPRPEDLDRFLREARSAAQLKHPGIVSVHDAGQVDGTLYLVSEFVQGATLAERLTAGRMSFRQAAALVAEVAEALAYAHAQGVIHRDIKASNIMLDLQGKPHVMDFGLAKRAAEEAGMTLEGQVLGTPAYMSPEQARGEVKKADARSDVYSLGVVFYELLTGELPFRGQARMLLVQVMQEEPRPPRKLNDRIPKDLETICLKAMAKEPGRRYATAQALANDLRRWQKGEPIEARPVGQLERLWRWSQRNPLVAGLTAAVFVLLAAVAGVASLGYVQTRLALGREATEHAEADRQRAAAEVAEEKAREAEQVVRQQLYAAKINLMQQAWDSGQVGHLQALLAETEQHPDRGFEWYYWQRMCHLDLHTIIGHSAGVWSVSWSADGKKLATGSEDGTVKLYDVANNQNLLTLKRHAGPVRSVSWSPDGQRLATGGSDGIAKVWEVASGRTVLILQGHTAAVRSVSWSANGKRLATGSDDGTAKVWETAGGSELFSLKGHSAEVFSAAWSPDGNRLVTGSGDGTAKVWDMAGNRELLSLKGHAGTLTSVSWSPDGQRLATGGVDRTAKVWEAASGRELFTFKGHMAAVRSVSWSPDGKRLATGSDDQTGKVWEAASDREVLTLKGHTSWVTCVSWSPDGKQLATGSLDGTAKVWEAAVGRDALTLKGHSAVVLSVAWSPDGKRLATGSDDGTAKLWETTCGRELLTLQTHKARARSASVSWSPDGKWLATGSNEGWAKVWDAAAGRELLKFKAGAVSTLSWSPDGKRLATASTDGLARVWEAATRRELFRLKGHLNIVYPVSWSPDGQRLATGSDDGTAKLWDAANGRELLTLKGHMSRVSSVSWSPDGKQLATASLDGMAKVWDAAGGRELLTLKGHAEGLMSVSWSRDGKRLATGSTDGTTKVWEAAGGRELLTLKGHTSGVSSVSWSPDGKRLATGSGDGTVKLWEIAETKAVQEWARQDQILQELLTLNTFRGPKARGFLQTWLLLLPLPLASGETSVEGLDRQQVADEAHLRPQPGERLRVGDRELAWQEHRSPEAVLDFNALLGQVTELNVAYAVCYLESDQAREDLWLKVGSDDQAKIFLNGRQIYQYRLPRGLPDSLDTVGPVALKQGTNVLVFKVVNELGGWEGCVRLVDQEDRPAKGIRVKLTPGE